MKSKQALRILDQEEYHERNNLVNKSNQLSYRKEFVLDEDSDLNGTNNSKSVNRTKIVYVNEDGITNIDP